MYLLSLSISSFSALLFTCITAANEAGHWTNTTTTSATSTIEASIALPRVNIKPPLSLLTESSYQSFQTATPTYNYFTAIASYASTTYGSADPIGQPEVQSSSQARSAAAPAQPAPSNSHEGSSYPSIQAVASSERLSPRIATSAGPIQTSVYDPAPSNEHPSAGAETLSDIVQAGSHPSGNVPSNSTDFATKVPSVDTADVTFAGCGSTDIAFDSSTSVPGQTGSDNAGEDDIVSVEREKRTPAPPTQTSSSLQPVLGVIKAAAESGHPEPKQSSPATTAPMEAAIGSQTLEVGGFAQTISDEIMSLASNGIIIGSKSIGLPRIQAGTQHISLPAGSGSELIGVTFIAGAIAGPDSTVRSAAAKITGSSHVAGPSQNPTIPRAVFTFGTHTYTAIKPDGSAEAVVQGKTFTAGSSGISVDGGTVSLDPEGRLIMQSERPSTLSPTATDVTTANAAEITLGSTTLTAVQPQGQRGVVEIGGTTLSPGGSALVIGDETLSALPKGFVTLGDNGTGTISLEETALARSTSLTSDVSTPTSPESPSVTSGIGSVRTGTPPSRTTSGAESARYARQSAFALLAGAMFASLPLLFT